MSIVSADYDDILHRVVSWPPAQRKAMAADILASVGERPRPKPARETLNRALGLLKGVRPAPDQAAVEQILQQHRMERYGE